MLEVEPPDRRRPATDEQKGRFLQPFRGGRSSLPARQGHQRADARAPTTGCRRATTPKAGLKLARRAPGRRLDPQRREVLHRQRAASASCSSSTRAPIRTRRCSQGTTMFLVPRDTAGLPHRQGVQQERLAVLPERRDDLRERARAARQRRSARSNGSDMKTAGGRRPHRRRPVRRPRARRQRARCLRRCLRAWR